MQLLATRQHTTISFSFLIHKARPFSKLSLWFMCMALDMQADQVLVLQKLDQKQAIHRRDCSVSSIKAACVQQASRERCYKFTASAG